MNQLMLDLERMNETGVTTIAGGMAIATLVGLLLFYRSDRTLRAAIWLGVYCAVVVAVGVSLMVIAVEASWWLVPIAVTSLAVFYAVSLWLEIRWYAWRDRVHQ